MVTVLRIDGLRIVIYVNDHQPAHVHVFGDGEAKINPGGAQWLSRSRLGRQDDAWRGPPIDAGRHRAADGPAAEMGGHSWPS